MGLPIYDPVEHCWYRTGECLGEGGFGRVYEAGILKGGQQEADDMNVVIKITEDARLWHGEVYFQSLLAGNSHVVRFLSSFSLHVPHGTGSRLVYAIVMENVSRGTIWDLMELAQGDPWPEARVVKKVRGLLQPLALLHDMGASHRDITPKNVFLGDRLTLKLGDFGISRTALTKAGVRVDAWNPIFCPKDLGTWWRPADDVYQVGLLMATLASGEVQTRELTKVAVNRIVPDGQLRTAIKAAISVKSQRPQNAGELADLLG